MRGHTPLSDFLEGLPSPIHPLSLLRRILRRQIPLSMLTALAYLLVVYDGEKTQDMLACHIQIHNLSSKRE